MSEGQTLRALVNERLAAAAEEIFVLIERTIAEYEEELCRSKEENQRKQQLLDKVLCPGNKLDRGNVQIPSTRPGPGLNQEITETPWIKEEPEEQSIKQEEELLPVPVPESSAVKTEESSLLEQRQTEHREQTQGEDISSEPYFHSETEGHIEHSSNTDNDDDWEPPFSSAAAQMETEADGDHGNQVQIRDRSTKLSPQNKSVPETTVHSGHMSGETAVHSKELSGAEGARKKHQCHFCNKRFGTKQQLQNHIRIHTGEKPYSCSICWKPFTQKGGLDVHTRTHTGEKPYSCPVCKQHFADHSTLRKHKRIHTRERPYRCEVCEKTFARKMTLDLHIKTHIRDKPYSCTVCDKGFCQKSKLHLHIRTHTGEKPYSCQVCKQHFADPSALKRHNRMHTGERPYSCTICEKTFTRKEHLNVHMSTHTI